MYRRYIFSRKSGRDEYFMNAMYVGWASVKRYSPSRPFSFAAKAAASIELSGRPARSSDVSHISYVFSSFSTFWPKRVVNADKDEFKVRNVSLSLPSRFAPENANDSYVRSRSVLSSGDSVNLSRPSYTAFTRFHNLSFRIILVECSLNLADADMDISIISSSLFAESNG